MCALATWFLHNVHTISTYKHTHKHSEIISISKHSLSLFFSSSFRDCCVLSWPFDKSNFCRPKNVFDVSTLQVLYTRHIKSDLLLNYFFFSLSLSRSLDVTHFCYFYCFTWLSYAHFSHHSQIKTKYCTRGLKLHKQRMADWFYFSHKIHISFFLCFSRSEKMFSLRIHELDFNWNAETNEKSLHTTTVRNYNH